VTKRSIFSFLIALTLFACSGDPEELSSSSVAVSSSSSIAESSSSYLAESSSSIETSSNSEESSSANETVPSSSSSELSSSSAVWSSTSDGSGSGSGSGLCEDFIERTPREHQGKSKAQFCDPRDGTKYVYVGIGNQIWMAENLNYDGGDGSVGRCYGDDNDNCNIYGRLYTLDEVVCPSGWHLPSKEEWLELLNFVHPNPNDGSYFVSTAGTKLKASRGWNGDGNGTDDYGFAALPGGYCGNSCPIENSPFSNIGTRSFWWSASVGAPAPLSITFSISSGTSVAEFQSKANSRFYARCVRDKDTP